MLTYWPGRKPMSALAVTFSSMAVGDSRQTSVTVPVTAWLADLLHRDEAAGISTTQSVDGTIWQVSTMPCAASSSDRASSIYSSPISNSPWWQEPLQVPQTPSEQSIGRLIWAR